MKFWWMVAVLGLASLFVMLAVDDRLGVKAEFLNAWSVAERLVGRAPSAGESVVARAVGSIGELVAVVLANLAVGGLLALVISLFSKKT